MPKNIKNKKAKSPVQDVEKPENVLVPIEPYDVLVPIERYIHVVECIKQFRNTLMDAFISFNLSSKVWSASLECQFMALPFLRDIYHCHTSLRFLIQNPQEPFGAEVSANMTFRQLIKCLVWIVNRTVQQTLLGEFIESSDEDYRIFLISRNILDVLGLVIRAPITEDGKTKDDSGEKAVMKVPEFPSEQFFRTIMKYLPQYLQESFLRDMASKQKKKKGKKGASQNGQPSTSSSLSPREQMLQEMERRSRNRARIINAAQTIQWERPEEFEHFKEYLENLEEVLYFKIPVFESPEYELKIVKYVTQALLDMVKEDDGAKEELSKMKEQLEKLKEELDEKNEMISERTSRISELTSISVQNTATLKRKEDEIARRDRKIEELNEQIRRKEAAKEEANFQKNKSKRETAEKDQKIKDLEKQIKDLLRLEDQKVKKIEASTEERFQATIDSQSEELQRKIDEAESWKLRFEKERKDHMEEIAAVNSEKQRQLDAFTTKIEAVNAHKQSLVENFTTEIAAVNDEKHRLVEGYRHNMETMRMENRRLSEAYQQLNVEFKNEKKKNYEKNQTIEQLTSEVTNLRYITSSGQSNTSSSSSSPPFVGQAAATSQNRQHAGRAQQTDVNPRWRSYQHSQGALSEQIESDPAQHLIKHWNTQKNSGGTVDQCMVDEVQMFYGMNSSWQAAQNGGESSIGQNFQEELDQIERFNRKLEVELENARNGHGTSFGSNYARQTVGRTQLLHGNGGQSQWQLEHNGQGTSSNHAVGSQVRGQVANSTNQLVPEYPPPVPFDVCLPPNHDKRHLLTLFEPTGDNCVGFSLLNKDNETNKFF
ncbi:hypothetical protein CAEBREN_07161 [Caenorhabditis brenneri]|uniref:Uncharacterized protein n=1 Tax=Caenorhabditis brenneri TaxID=135651 RepID=G0MX37_CAEBE|nr:hypothetical protein CAEBREN_07161 [Caenorhabditis brenneri]